MLNNIDIYENIVIFVHILSSFNDKITLIDKIDIILSSWYKYEKSQP